MPAKCDAIINFADHQDDSSYCFIIDLDAKKKEACVRVEKNHRLCENDKIIIETYDDIKGMLTYEGTVKRTTSDEAFLHKLQLIDEKQRRSDVRVNINYRLALKGISEGRIFTKPDTKVILEALTVSASGMLIRTDIDVDEKACLVFDFPLDTRYISCKAEIVRKKKEGDFNLYGCHLLINENDRVELRRFVFKTQIELKKINFNEH